MKTSPLVVVLLCLCAVQVSAAEPSAPVEIAPFPRALVQSAWIEPIWADGRHNGFPGIARVGDYYYVAFRNANSHKDTGDTKIVVIRAPAAELKPWTKVFEFTRDRDVRDPLVLDNGGKVQLVFHSKEDFYSQSADGLTWSEPQELKAEFVQPRPDSGLVFSSQRRWLFRIRRGPDGAFYSLARCGIKDANTKGGTFGLILYRGEDGVNFKGMHQYDEGPTRALNLAGGSGWGHESDVAWTPDGTLVAAIRNSANGVVAMGKAPNGPWKAFNSGAGNFGGPALHTTRQGGMLLAARDVPTERFGFPASLKLWTVTNEGLMYPRTLPSGGDCAYQSFADGPGPEEVLLVYYSSHEYPQPAGTGENPTKIYLAHLNVRHDGKKP